MFLRRRFRSRCGGHCLHSVLQRRSAAALHSPSNLRTLLLCPAILSCRFLVLRMCVWLSTPCIKFCAPHLALFLLVGGRSVVTSGARELILACAPSECLLLLAHGPELRYSSWYAGNADAGVWVELTISLRLQVMMIATVLTSYAMDEAARVTILL